MIRFKTYYHFTIFFILFIAFEGNAAGKQQLKHDSVSMQRISVPAASLDKLKKHHSFKYTHPTASQSFMSRFWMWLNDLYVFRMISGMTPWLIYSMLILAFAVVIVVLFRSRFHGVFIRNKADSGMYISGHEISENINFETMLHEALEQKNYNLAIRYWYLSILRTLNQKKLITYRPGKTNFEYLSEITDPDIASRFRTVTRNYEYAWYGQFPMTESSYREIADECKTLTDKLYD